MPNEIHSIPNPFAKADHPVNQQNDSASSTQQAQQDQTRQADEARKSQEAQDVHSKRTATEILQSRQETPGLAKDFLSLIENIVQEAYEAPQESAGGKSADHDTGNMSSKQNSATYSQKDLQILKEFIREANYLIKSQNMDVAQMLNTIKVEQGGAFWNKVQEMLQKGIPASQMVIFQNLEKNIQEISKQFMGMEGFSKLGQTLNTESGQIQPGRALLEIIKAESNPQGSMDRYMMALQILMRDGMEHSAQKLVSYLRRRSGLLNQTPQASHWADLFRKDIVAYVPQKVEKDLAHWWYVVFSIATFGALVGLGFDWFASLLVGVSIGVVIFIFGLVFKK